jgi:hypothetical protein
MVTELAKAGERTLVYWPLRNTGANYPVKSALAPLAPAAIAAAQTEGVRLWSMREDAFNRLANHGYYLADCAMQSYRPPSNGRSPSYPFPLN